MPGGSKIVGAVMAGGLALAALGACSSGSDNPPPPPPPPAAFGQTHDWGNGNSLTVEAPKAAVLPGNLHALVVLVKVHNGSQSAVPANQYHTDVKVNDSLTSAAAFGSANIPQGQVQSNSDGQYPVVFEQPAPGQKLDVVVSGPNNLPAVAYEGQSPDAG
jgi:hypothetical protein